MVVFPSEFDALTLYLPASSLLTWVTFNRPFVRAISRLSGKASDASGDWVEGRFLFSVDQILKLWWKNCLKNHERRQGGGGYMKASPPPTVGQARNVVQWIFRGLNILQLFLGKRRTQKIGIGHYTVYKFDPWNQNTGHISYNRWTDAQQNH